MNKIITVLPFSANDAVLAERLLDFIYFLNDREQHGPLLLASYDVHAELSAKVKIAAEVAFSSVILIDVPKIQSKEQVGKNYFANHLFRHASQWVQRHGRWPWLWLEPDCAPLRKDWLTELVRAYDEQPLRHMGSHMKAPDRVFMARVGVYHPGTFSEVDKYCEGEVPCHVATDMVQRCSKTKLIQQMPVNDSQDIEKLREDAVLLHGDKLGIVSESKHAVTPLKVPIIDESEPILQNVLVTSNKALNIQTTPSIVFTPAQERMAKARAARGHKKEQVPQFV